MKKLLNLVQQRGSDHLATLLLRLNAPLQSWGSESIYDNRETDNIPTKSGVIGLVAASLGRKRTESVDDLVNLQFGVRIDEQGYRLRDYQTTQMGEKLNANLSNRIYLSDATFLAGLGYDDESFLRKIEEALRNPVFSPYLGRKSCPPTLPFVLGIRKENLLTALTEEEWQLPLERQRRLLRNQDSVKLRIIVDAEDKTGEALKKDVPISFSPFRRSYGYRCLAERKPREIYREEVISITEHDAMSELG